MCIVFVTSKQTHLKATCCHACQNRNKAKPLKSIRSCLWAVFPTFGEWLSKIPQQPHCPIRVSTRPAWHSKFYAWLFLLWPRLIQNSCWINLKGGAFWENLSSVVTSLDSWKTNWEIIKRTFLLAIRGITVNIVTTTEILIPVQAFLKAFIASYFLFLGDIQCWPNKTQRFYFHQG